MSFTAFELGFWGGIGFVCAVSLIFVLEKLTKKICARLERKKESEATDERR